MPVSVPRPPLRGRANGCGRQITLQSGFVRVGLAVCMILYMFLFSSGGGAFIYFQF
jgi:hypothetical protein